MKDKQIRGASIRYELEIALKAIDQLAKIGIPPEPQYFELFYHHIAGTHPVLSERIREVLADEDASKLDVVRELCSEVFAQANQAAVSDRYFEQVVAETLRTNRAIRNAVRETTADTSSLEAVSRGILSGSSDIEMKEYVAEIATAMRTIVDRNEKVEQRLDQAQMQIDSLSQDLEAARQEASRDPLTQLHNRRSFDHLLDQKIEHAFESDEPMALTLIDIDHFKRFNDAHGHVVGDQVLRLVAESLRENARTHDVVARIGGEEFGIIMPKTSLMDAVFVAERLRTNLEKSHVAHMVTRKKIGVITASFGVAALTGRETPTELFHRADVCLYQAKGAGRNRVMSGPEDRAGLVSARCAV